MKHTAKTIAVLLLGCTSALPFSAYAQTASGETWTECAKEWGGSEAASTCKFTGRREVRYGRSDKGFITAVAEGNVFCDDSSFGAPKSDFQNVCYYSSQTTTAPVTVSSNSATGGSSAGWTECAKEWGGSEAASTCKFTGRRHVRYGRPEKGFTVVVAENGVYCDDVPFLAPPTNYQNICYYSNETTDVPLSVNGGVVDPVDTPEDPTWSKCADENQTCAFTGTKLIRFGAQGQYRFKQLTDGTPCTVAVFTDPGTNAAKSCWIDLSGATHEPTPAEPNPTTPPSTAANWVQCAREYGTCSFSGRHEVRYGREDKGFITKVAENGTSCDDGPFGAPRTDYENFCFYNSQITAAAITIGTGPSTPSPAPNPAPTPTPSPSPAPNNGAAGPRIANFTDSGPITVNTAGQVISGVRISNPGGVCININAPNVTIRDSVIGPCGGGANIAVNAANALVEYNRLTDGFRGVATNGNNGLVVRNNYFENFTLQGRPYEGGGTAIEFNYVNSGLAENNTIRGDCYSDCISSFQASGVRIVGNNLNVQMLHMHSAPIMMGDAGPNINPGSDLYMGYNTVTSSGGVDPGLAGCSGNCVIEKNCFLNGISVFWYNGNPQTGLTIRNNMIGPDSAVIDGTLTAVAAGWNTNVFGTSCSQVP